MLQASSVALEERVCGDTTWLAIRARGAEWSWLTQDEALRMAATILAKWGNGALPSQSIASAAREAC